jgi:hypothetical protein
VEKGEEEEEDRRFHSFFCSIIYGTIFVAESVSVTPSSSLAHFPSLWLAMHIFVKLVMHIFQRASVAIFQSCTTNPVRYARCPNR